ncbi:MAG: hypothetical protein ABJC13_04520 [Acidobacteriota bacterium]
MKTTRLPLRVSPGESSQTSSSGRNGMSGVLPLRVTRKKGVPSAPSTRVIA